MSSSILSIKNIKKQTSNSRNDGTSIEKPVFIIDVNLSMNDKTTMFTGCIPALVHP